MIKTASANARRRRAGTRNDAARTGNTASVPDRPRGNSPPDSIDLQPAIRLVMMPRDANYLGTIFGGVILSSIDMAGAVEAHKRSDRKLVTAAMHEVKFIAPVFVGDLVSFYTETVKIGTTSITVRVTVEATRALAPHETARVTQAEVVYVAINEAGKPVPVQP
ncbi:MAG TPA: hotdog domain-containing protein [Candidatus Baltobacteraceae bacterium]|jgi:acyl-CoA thioesterase YciA|nr:hotdog domain-containing protein [Candidatus Baltobacteraceae bacterium]